MVFGLGPGKVDLQLERTTFKVGDTIKGTVVLDLKQAVNARQVRVSFYGERQERRRNMQGRMETRTQTVYRFDVKLDGEKEYTAGRQEFPFEIAVPAGIVPQVPKVEGVIGMVAGFLMAPAPIYWYLDAALDIPLGIDVSKKVQISVS